MLEGRQTRPFGLESGFLGQAALAAPVKNLATVSRRSSGGDQAIEHLSQLAGFTQEFGRGREQHENYQNVHGFSLRSRDGRAVAELLASLFRDLTV